jgi:hypothetical protein
MAHLHAPVPQSDPDHTRRRPSSDQAADPVAQRNAPPEAGHADARLLGLPGTIRQQAVLQLQRLHGNRHVQTLLGQGPAAAPATVQAQAVPQEEDEPVTQAEGEEDELQAEGEEDELQAEGEEDELQAEGEDDELQAEGEEDELQAVGEEDELQAESEEDELQAKGDSGARPRRTPNVSARVRAQRGGGSPLDSTSVQRFSAAFGRSFDHVRVHTDDSADRLNRDLSARAFTSGNDIFFRSGKYAPGTAEGDHLIAHELTHVVQQGQGVVPTGHQSSGGPAGRTPADPFEQEAEATADAVTQGKPLPGTTPATKSDA